MKQDKDTSRQTDFLRLTGTAVKGCSSSAMWLGHVRSWQTRKGCFYSLTSGLRCAGNTAPRSKLQVEKPGAQIISRWELVPRCAGYHLTLSSVTLAILSNETEFQEGHTARQFILQPYLTSHSQAQRGCRAPGTIFLNQPCY